MNNETGQIILIIAILISVYGIAYVTGSILARTKNKGGNVLLVKAESSVGCSPQSEVRIGGVLAPVTVPAKKVYDFNFELPPDKQVEFNSWKTYTLEMSKHIEGKRCLLTFTGLSGAAIRKGFSFRMEV